MWSLPQNPRGEFKDVVYTKDDIEKNLERKYHPGD
jgi:acyl-homoserine-lactone acylase